MLEFSHVISDPEGFHARPVARVALEARLWKSEVTVARGASSSSARDLIGLMGLIARCGDELTVTVEGADEAACCEAMRSVFDF